MKREGTKMDRIAEKYLNEEMIARSVAEAGDTGRLKKLFERAKAGEKLTVAFLGGSITQGCLSSIPETCYAYLVYDWFVRTFPKSEFIYVNAGIGGTTSQFGAARLDEDVLACRPDFCMVEFSVNDSDNVFFKETYESVVSRILESRTQPAVMILHNLFYENGHNAQKQHLAVGKAYRVPCVSVRDALYPELEAGRISIPQLSTDGLHPNDDGHAVLAGLVTDRLEHILKEYEDECGSISDSDNAGDKGTRRITPDSYCTVRRIGNKGNGIVCRGFVPDSTPKENFLDIFKGGWNASKTGDEIGFEFTGTELGIQYRKTVRRPAPVAVAVIDGDEEHPVVLDANFDQDWGDSLHIDTLLYHGYRVDPAAMYGDFETLPAADGTTGNPTAGPAADGTTGNHIAGSPAGPAASGNDNGGIEKVCLPPSKHHVTIRIVETHEDDRETFCLVSFIAG